MTQTQYSIEQVSEAFGKYSAQLEELESSYNEGKEALTKKLAAIKQWLWVHGEHTADSVVEEYIQMRDRRATIKALYDSEDEAIKKEMEARETWLLVALQQFGGESIRTSHGTAYKQLKVRSSCADWPAYWAWMAQTGRFDGVEKRVGQKMISDMLEAGQELPPGINTHTEQTVTIRKA